MKKDHNLTENASPVSRIKSRLSLRETARIVGHNLPNRDGIKFCSPLRPDKTPSCTIAGEIMRDWSRDKSYDAIAYFAEAKGITNGEAIKQLAEHLGITTGRRSPSATRPAAAESRSPGVVFDSTSPTDADFASIIASRRLPLEALPGLTLASISGVLHFGRLWGYRCWIVSDSSRRVAEARRLDGLPFPAVGPLAERKVNTLKGSAKSWPCGLAIGRTREQLRDTPLVIVEGGPDLLCAFGLLASLGPEAKAAQPCALLGASQNISAEALGIIAKRETIILAHGDAAGRAAGDRWAKQLVEAGSRVILRELPDEYDLNDAVVAHGLDALKETVQP